MTKKCLHGVQDSLCRLCDLGELVGYPSPLPPRDTQFTKIQHKLAQINALRDHWLLRDKEYLATWGRKLTVPISVLVQDLNKILTEELGE